MKSLDEKKNKWVPSFKCRTKKKGPRKCNLQKRKGRVPRFMVSRVEKKKTRDLKFNLDRVIKYMLPHLQLCWLNAVLMQFSL